MDCFYRKILRKIKNTQWCNFEKGTHNANDNNMNQNSKLYQQSRGDGGIEILKGYLVKFEEAET